MTDSTRQVLSTVRRDGAISIYSCTTYLVDFVRALKGPGSVCPLTTDTEPQGKMAFQAVTWHWRRTRSDKLEAYPPANQKPAIAGRLTFEVDTTSWKLIFRPTKDCRLQGG